MQGIHGDAIKDAKKCPTAGYPDIVDLEIFCMIFRIWEGWQSIGNGFGIDLDGFSARKVEYESILKDFHESGSFWCSLP